MASFHLTTHYGEAHSQQREAHSKQREEHSQQREEHSQQKMFGLRLTLCLVAVIGAGLNTYAQDFDCSPQNQCKEEQGDCDAHEDCGSGLFCGKNNCYGQFNKIPQGSRKKDDCCTKHLNYCNPRDQLPRSRTTCCSIDDRCPAGEGDCDKDQDCLPGLICGENNCKKFYNYAGTFDDCCVDPNAPPPPDRPEFGFCTSRNPCGKGEGDCATGKDNTCAGDLVCGSNNCRQFHNDAHPKMDCCMEKF